MTIVAVTRYITFRRRSKQFGLKYSMLAEVKIYGVHYIQSSFHLFEETCIYWSVQF